MVQINMIKEAVKKGSFFLLGDMERVNVGAKRRLEDGSDWALSFLIACVFFW